MTANPSDADLKVQDVGSTGFPTSCGKWQIVTSTGFPDLKVYRYTTPDAATDFKIVIDAELPGPSPRRPVIQRGPITPSRSRA